MREQILHLCNILVRPEIKFFLSEKDIKEIREILTNGVAVDPDILKQQIIEGENKINDRIKVLEEERIKVLTELARGPNVPGRSDYLIDNDKLSFTINELHYILKK